jgi:hypothetical protein
VEDLTAPFGSRLVETARCACLRPGIIHCDSPDRPITHTEYMFNIGPVPTIKLDWLQPLEGNLVDFLFRARAFQQAPI